METKLYDIRLKRKQPQKLQDLCLEVVAKNFNEFVSRPGSEINAKFLARLSQKLLKKFSETEEPVSLEKALFCINPCLRELDFRWFELPLISPVINKMQTMGIPLIDLCVHRKTSREDLWELVCSLPKTLKYLSLTHTKCVDFMLEVVAQRCPALLFLDLSFCKAVSDVGMKSLCLEDQEGNVCPNLLLQELHVDHTGVTEEGVGFILQNFPNLSKLKHKSLNDFILTKELANNNVLNTYNLKSVFCVLPRFSSTCLNVLRAFRVLCPFVTELSVEIKTQAELEICSEFTLLKKAKFPLSFPYDMQPFLTARGENLTHFFFHAISSYVSLSLRAFVQFCPQLECLELAWPKFTEISSLTDRNVQNKLHQLMFLKVAFPHEENLEKSLTFLFSRSPNLKKFHVELSDNEPFALSFVDFLVPCTSMVPLNELRFFTRSINVHQKLINVMPHFKLCEP